MNGKGSKRRPCFVTDLSERWDNIDWGHGNIEDRIKKAIHDFITENKFNPSKIILGRRELSELLISKSFFLETLGNRKYAFCTYEIKKSKEESLIKVE